jgi:2-polyprenyl-6-methoxyphenol hydroxylase-like FAD-dependent oxidoreductase
VSTSETTHGVVLGGGMAGMLAARVLRRHLDRVTVVDRDDLPDGPELRKGVPQARHAHLLWSGGARLIESLLPGTIARLAAAGAHRIGVHEDMVSLSAYGWQHRFPETQFLLAASRALLDWVVRDETTRDPAIQVSAGTSIVDLYGTADRVGGVNVSGPGGAETLDADVVVDASGRGSRLQQWLKPLGVTPPTEDTVDSGITYATRIYRAPHRAAAKFPMVSVYADFRERRPGQSGLVLPIENGQWIVTLSGTRGGEPPTDEEGFVAFARGLRYPLVGELIATAEPLTPVRGSRSTANRRRYYERLERWPSNLVVLGDALAAFNPIYGHGMSAAARSAAALDRALRRQLGRPDLARAAFAGIARAVDDPWILAASQDAYYPDCTVDVTDPRLTEQLATRQRFAEVVGTAALCDPVVSAAATGVTALAAPVSSLESPSVVSALRQGNGRALLDGPPLTNQEWALVADEPAA